MARLYAALMFDDDREPRPRIFRNRQDAFSLYDDSFIRIFRLSKDLVRRLCDDLRDRLCPISYAHTAKSVETQVSQFLSFLFQIHLVYCYCIKLKVIKYDVPKIQVKWNYMEFLFFRNLDLKEKYLYSKYKENR